MWSTCPLSLTSLIKGCAILHPSSIYTIVNQPLVFCRKFLLPWIAGVVSPSIGHLLWRGIYNPNEALDSSGVNVRTTYYNS